MNASSVPRKCCNRDKAASRCFPGVVDTCSAAENALRNRLRVSFSEVDSVWASDSSALASSHSIPSPTSVALKAELSRSHCSASSNTDWNAFTFL